MTLTQKIVMSSVLKITEILIIEDHKLYDTFLHVAFGSQSFAASKFLEGTQPMSQIRLNVALF
jgi:hypothetical protein